MMSQSDGTESTADLKQIIESASRLGVELDEEEALQWLTAIAASQGTGDNVVFDIQSGVFGTGYRCWISVQMI